jgi:transposase
VEKLIFVDETGIDCKTIYRRFGRAIKGTPVHKVRQFTGNRRWNVLSAISWNGIVSYTVTENTTNTVDFNKFIGENVLPHVPAGSVIVMDNASFHNATELEALVELQGHKIIFLPPYSPDLNPIEISYSYAKSYLKERVSKKYYSNTDMVNLIKEAFASMDAIYCQSWFKKCLYSPKLTRIY